eukprot:jgi/Botrbrau1/5606/Bobra.97_2s0029.1
MKQSLTLVQNATHGLDSSLAQRAAHLFTLIADTSAATQIDLTAQQIQDAGWLQPVVDALDVTLNYIQQGLDQLHVPYSYGWAIISLTLLTKILTFPFTRIQVESALSIQELKPQVDEIKRIYGDDKDKIQRETSALYEEAGVNPLAGCLPSLATLPVFWGLFRTLNNAATGGQMTAGFYWIPSLSGPTNFGDQQYNGVSWLLPLVDGAPAVGWEAAGAYLVLPVLLVLSQYVSSAIITPPINPDDENANTQKALLGALPLVVGYFALIVPSGLGLYYFSNTVLTSAIQIWLRKLGGAAAFEFQQEIGLGQARRAGEPGVLEPLPFLDEPLGLSQLAGSAQLQTESGATHSESSAAASATSLESANPAHAAPLQHATSLSAPASAEDGQIDPITNLAAAAEMGEVAAEHDAGAGNGASAGVNGASAPLNGAAAEDAAAGSVGAGELPMMVVRRSKRTRRSLLKGKGPGEADSNGDGVGPGGPAEEQAVAA